MKERGVELTDGGAVEPAVSEVGDGWKGFFFPCYFYFYFLFKLKDREKRGLNPMLYQHLLFLFQADVLLFYWWA
jgi:hypothetical protein